MIIRLQRDGIFSNPPENGKNREDQDDRELLLVLLIRETYGALLSSFFF